MFAGEPAPAVWGVGRLVVDGAVTPWPVSESDIDDEAEAAVAHMASLGVGAGDVVLIVALLSEAIHAVPLEKAAGLAGALYSAADATASDAARTEYLIRQLRPRAVVGVNEAVVSGLRARGREPADVFASVPAVVTADDAAWRLLVGAGLAPRRLAKIGPTSALECAARSGLHLDGERWEVVVADGRVVLEDRATRMTPCARLRTGFVGTIARDPCPCGRPGPRLVPARPGSTSVGRVVDRS
jgi:phenylacetate-coenzyme A ligase PaaK-like adenylate-forming protein